ncbi:MAG: methyltransferase [Bryobacterales bacterium]|nr:methyltransferase [Bryobacterales bacterium]
MKYERVRQYLAASGYTSEFLLQHFDLPSLHLLFYPVGRQGEKFAQQYRRSGTALFLARVFIGGYGESREAFREHMPDAVFDAMAEGGILEQVAGGEWQSPGLVFPFRGFFIAADRAFRGQQQLPLGRDYVAGGADPTSVEFYDNMASTPCRTLLEMGTGSGIGALLASRFAERVWALDINPRAVEYARRNCELNGVENVTAMESDLYSATDGQTFERIVANLPFVPSDENTAVFAAGGDDGERILAGFLEGCAERLTPGGRLYALVMGSDREEDGFESRIRRYLGSGGEDCDVALFARKTMTPAEFAFDRVALRNSESAALFRWVRFMEQHRIEQMVLGTLLVQRREAERPAVTLRHTLSPGATVEDMDRRLSWETRCARPDFAASILSARPTASEGWRVLTKHAMEDGKMATISHSILVTHPFEETVECAPWVVSLAARVDGERTVSQLLGAIQKQTGAPGDVLLRVFAQLAALGVAGVR